MTTFPTTADATPDPITPSLAAFGDAENRPAAEDPRAVASGLLSAALEIGGTGTVTERRFMVEELSRVFGLSPTDAREYAVVGSWLARQAETPAEAISDLANSLAIVDGGPDREEMSEMLRRVLSRPTASMPDAVNAALNTLPAAAA